MRRLRKLGSRKQAFRLLASTRRSQVASMVLRPGETSGSYGTDHPQSDQVLYVIDGTCDAVVRGRRTRLVTGDALVVPAGERHEIRNAGRKPLKTLNVYAPSAY